MKDRPYLLAALEDLDRRLRCSWSRLLPMTSDLQGYKEEWESSFSGEIYPSRKDDLLRAASAAEPLLVGDYHAVSRPQNRLGNLLNEIEWEGGMGLILELLPAPLLLPASEILANPKLLLIDGRSVADTYKKSLSAIASRGGLVAGAWVNGNAQHRDAVAAQLWHRLNKIKDNRHWTLFFGDWHLAEKHLPKALREKGAKPTVIHQSPEPLWSRRPKDCRESILKLNSNNWAWIHSHPLGHWAEAVQYQNAFGSSASIETAESLCEDICEALVKHLGLPAPSAAPGIRSSDEWPEFLASMPTWSRLPFQANKKPEIAIYHPSNCQTWCPRTPTLNNLLESAAWAISEQNHSETELNWVRQAHRVAFRRMLASLFNPFLIPCSKDSLARQLFGQKEKTYLSPTHSAFNYLMVENLGHHAGAEISRESELSIS
ncbi:MAG TPA: hypothetical protein DDW23_04185, partial [Planctomycetes bacterium]|nr:hypothetical protein [Planctomycetota bacterium]